MNKAFTREEGAPEAPTLRAAPTLAPGEVRYITPEGHASLLAERAALEAELVRVRGSDNLEAPTRRVELEAKLTGLDQLLAILTVARPEPSQAGRVFFGAHVRLEDEVGAEVRYQIVGPDETDARAGKISVDSPLARQLLGRAPGDAVELRRPRGTTELTVIEIRY